MFTTTNVNRLEFTIFQSQFRYLGRFKADHPFRILQKKSIH